MTFSTDWDVEKYRAEHECEEHWELRRRFLETHKDKFPEDRLVCLAQVFYNVEFMGCRYPEKTMRQVAELSRGVADDHREKMKSKLQRTFVQASDAASTKVKGQKRNGDAAQNKRKYVDFQRASEDNQLPVKKIITEAVPKNKEETNPPKHIPGRFVLADQSSFDSKTFVQNPSMNRPCPIRQQKQDDTLADIVLVESAMTSPFTILDRSLRGSNKRFKTQHRKVEKQHECTMFVGDEVLATASCETAKQAQQKCAALGLARLKKICYTLLVKDNLAGVTVDKTEDGSIEDGSKIGKSTEISNAVPEHLAEDSKVSRMMKLMGWGGKGLGKDQQGRTEPVQAANVVRRAGLGLISEGGSGSKMKMKGNEFNRCIRKLINDFQSSRTSENLVFAADFSKEERKTIHLIARNLGVRSQSYGTGDDRRLVLRRNVSYKQILEEVKEAGGTTAKYDLIPPEGN